MPQDGEQAVQVARAYLARWGIEESYRFWKQAFNAEDVRLLTWRGLRRMMTLLLLTCGFLALEMHEQRARTLRIVRRFARAFGPTPNFVYYRLVDAYHVLLSVHGWLRSSHHRPP